jgi:hypothetical protein
VLDTFGHFRLPGSVARCVHDIMATVSDDVRLGPSNRTARHRALRKHPPQQPQTLQLLHTGSEDISALTASRISKLKTYICLDELVSDGESEMRGILDFVRTIVWHRAEHADHLDKHDPFVACFYQIDDELYSDTSDERDGMTCDDNDHDDQHHEGEMHGNQEGSAAPGLVTSALNFHTVPGCLGLVPSPLDNIDPDLWHEVVCYVGKGLLAALTQCLHRDERRELCVLSNGNFIRICLAVPFNGILAYS